MTMVASTLSVLERLVAFDTRNPPRQHTPDSAVFAYLKEQLHDFNLTEWNHGEGCVTQLYVRGNPQSVFNFHLDTVPVAKNWQGDPFTLRRDNNRAIGLGACDIKGALATMIAASQAQDGDVAILVTSDEEAGDSTCVKQYLATRPAFKNVFVAEPTSCQAVVSHRGILSGRLIFNGATGHASSATAVSENAIHRAMNWGAAVQRAVSGESANDTLSNTRFNIGCIEGGIKPNMIASRVELGYNVRTAPGQDQQQVIDALLECADPAHVENAAFPFIAPALPTADRGSEAIALATALAERNSIVCAPPVDFWTEAALFSAAGFTTVVLGSGDIAQAHTANEWVALDDLDNLFRLYQRLIKDGIK